MVSSDGCIFRPITRRFDSVPIEMYPNRILSDMNDLISYEDIL